LLRRPNHSITAAIRLNEQVKSPHRNQHSQHPNAHVSALFHAVFSLKALDAPGGIDQALLSGVEGMAIRAHFDVDFRQGGTRFEGVAARARNEAAAVRGMDISFHSRVSAYMVRQQK